MDRKQLYGDVTAEVVRQIEAGAGDWKMPWCAIPAAGQPVNASTGNAYRGGNHMWFAMVATGRGYSGEWATYKQWAAMGAQVRKGERATHGVKWSVLEDKETAERRLVPYAFCVFAAEQVDGYEPKARAELNTPERIDAAEVFFDAIGADVRQGGNRAAYSASADFIVIPRLEQFADAADFYSTLAHEHAHWTGHETRLNRSLANRFGSDAYAAEELVAELSAAFTCAHLGISQAPRPDHAAYLDSWLRVLRADTSALFAAASKAQAASDFLIASAGVHADASECEEVAA